MSATVSWSEDQIIELEFDSPWTWKDYDTAAETMDMMAGMAAGSVSVILDLRNAPQSSTVIEHVHRSLHTKPENIRRIVIVATPTLNELLRRALAGTDGLLPGAIEFAGSIQEAHGLLATPT